MLMGSIQFYTTENMNTLWGFVKTLLTAASPGVMIWFAITGVGFLLAIVVKAFRESAKDKRNDDDEDIEVRHY